MTLTILLILTLLFALLPLAMLSVNLLYYRSPQSDVEGESPEVTLLIPARDEAQAIGECLEAALASRHVDLRVIVLDDHSTDETAEIVRSYARRDSRVQLESAPPLPAGWCGKQHACYILAQHAQTPWIAWIDADVRLSPDALARMIAYQQDHDVALLSAFPRQVTCTWLEKLVIPQIHLVLLCYLPMWQMRASTSPGFSAGCGQLFITDRESYFEVGGHEKIKQSLHDGVKLPREYRKAGKMTDIVDGLNLASCRMYRSAAEVWMGFAKNATEGMASKIGIWVWTVLLGFGHLLPWVLGFIVLSWHQTSSMTQLSLASGAMLASVSVNMILGLRFRQGIFATVLRPIGVTIMLAIQWYARIQLWRGRPTAWRGRHYDATCDAISNSPS